MAADPGKDRQVIGMSDMLWFAVILAWAFGVVETFALFVINNDIWLLTATLLAVAMCMMYRVVLTRQGIRVALMIPFLSYEVQWRDIVGIELNETGNAVHLRLAAGGCISIPLWFLKLDVESLADVYSRWHGTHRLRTCIACDYDLFGTTSPTCPECGTEIHFQHKTVDSDSEQSPRINLASSSDQMTIQ